MILQLTCNLIPGRRDATRRGACSHGEFEAGAAIAVDWFTTRLKSRPRIRCSE